MLWASILGVGRDPITLLKNGMFLAIVGESQCSKMWLNFAKIQEFLIATKCVNTSFKIRIFSTFSSNLS